MQKIFNFLRRKVAQAIAPATMIRLPYGMDFPDNSTKKHFWRHPPGFPYQIYGGPLAPVGGRWEDQIWTSEKSLPDYELIEDAYSDRLYFVYRGKITNA